MTIHRAHGLECLLVGHLVSDQKFQTTLNRNSALRPENRNLHIQRIAKVGK